MKRDFKTLRGFLEGRESDEESYFYYSATLRIFGDIPNLEEISANLGLRPTKTHFKGEKSSSRHPGFKQDMWSYTPTLAQTRPLRDHIDTLWRVLKPHKSYLLQLKKSVAVDVFLGYRSNCDTAGIEIPHTSLEMFVELEIPVGLSVIIS